MSVFALFRDFNGFALLSCRCLVGGCRVRWEVGDISLERLLRSMHQMQQAVCCRMGWDGGCWYRKGDVN